MRRRSRVALSTARRELLRAESSFTDVRIFTFVASGLFLLGVTAVAMGIDSPRALQRACLVLAFLGFGLCMALCCVSVLQSVRRARIQLERMQSRPPRYWSLQPTKDAHDLVLAVAALVAFVIALTAAAMVVVFLR
jgi:hypothetical protein